MGSGGGPVRECEARREQSTRRRTFCARRRVTYGRRDHEHLILVDELDVVAHAGIDTSRRRSNPQVSLLSESA